MFLILSTQKLMFELQLDLMNTKLVICQVFACLRPKVGLLNWYCWNIWRIYLCILVLFSGILLTSCRGPQYDLLFQILTQGPQFSCNKALIMIFLSGGTGQDYWIKWWWNDDADRTNLVGWGPKWLINLIPWIYMYRKNPVHINSYRYMCTAFFLLCTDTTDWKW